MLKEKKKFLFFFAILISLSGCYKTQKESDQNNEQYSELELLVGRPCVPMTKVDPDRYEDPLSVLLIDDKTMCGVEMPNAICITKFGKNDTDYVAQSSCSCRCKDQWGNADENTENICSCPEDSECFHIFDERAESIPETLRGGYCFPKCFYDEECETYCTPPKEDFEDNWEWQCNSKK